jgi:hypothetical protein
LVSRTLGGGAGKNHRDCDSEYRRFLRNEESGSPYGWDFVTTGTLATSDGAYIGPAPYLPHPELGLVGPVAYPHERPVSLFQQGEVPQLGPNLNGDGRYSSSHNSKFSEAGRFRRETSSRYRP